jgi:hypothetical protein
MIGTKKKQIIPYATRYLFINCYRPDNPLFKGIYAVTQLFKKRRNCRCLDYKNGIKLDLSKRRKLAWVLISGHGGEDGARMTDGEDTYLYPQNIKLPYKTKLFLLGCHQGLPMQEAEWAKGTGSELNNIYGAEGETETALSTICLLSILEGGIETMGKWFIRWIEANAYFRPRFKEMREIYEAQGKIFAKAIAEIGKRIDLKPFMDMLSVGMNHPEYLDNIG